MTNIENRRRQIAEIISREGFANVADLAKTLKVTPVTIRTDLRSLEKTGTIRRSHGGAIAISRTVRDICEEEKSAINPALKRKIAKKALSFVEKDDAIIMATSSTLTMFAEQLEAKGKLNVITPSVRITMALLNKPGVSVFQLGGSIYGNTLSARGEYAQEGLKYLHASKLFFGAEGFDPQYGISSATLEEAELTRKMIQSSSQVILLADSTKFCRRGYAKICDISDIDILITDAGLPEQSVRKLENLGVEVVIAE